MISTYGDVALLDDGARMNTELVLGRKPSEVKGVDWPNL